MPTSDFARSRTGGYTILCHIVHINSLLQMHEPYRRGEKTSGSSNIFFLTSALLCISALFMTNDFICPSAFWCKQYSRSWLLIFCYAIINTAILGVGKHNILEALYTLASSSSSIRTAATPFLFPFILPTTPRGRADARGSSSAVISRDQIDSSRIRFGTGTGSIKAVIPRI